MRIAIYGNRRQSGIMDRLRILLGLLGRRADGGLVVIDKFYDYVDREMPGIWPANAVAVRPCEDFSADVAVSIGGDGTFLRTVQWVAERYIPILGINTGHLGYLADLSIDEALTEPEVSSFKVEERSLLKVECGCNDADFWPYALNEVAILKKDISSMISMTAEIDGAPLASYLADGLIVSTPTGSTGYCLSVGGPVVEPSVPAVIIAPVAPHSLTLRPLVVSDAAEIEVTTSSRSDSYLLSLDGRSVSMEAGSRVRICGAPFKVRVIQRVNHHFASTLRSKLYWGKSHTER